MELRQIEVQILLDIYEMDLNNEPTINKNDYELTERDNQTKTKEFAMYLIKLKRHGYIDFDEHKTFLTGGIINEKYKNNVLLIYPEKIQIKDKGIECAENIKKTVAEKMKDESKDIAKKIYYEIKDFTTKTIAEYFIGLTKNS